MSRGVFGKTTQRSFVRLMVMLNKTAPEEEAATVAAHFHPYPGPVGVPVPSINAFSALHLLRNYNQLLLPPDVSQRYRQLISQNCLPDDYKLSANSFPPPPPTLLAPHTLLGYQPVAATAPLFTATPNSTPESQHSPVLNRTLISSTSPRRQRGEKKPIPEDQKDDKYFERRRRNNQAAKKSRDARKMREDQIAFRATMLEHENAILRAQILTLREEATSLRQMLIVKKSDGNQPQTIEHQINCR